MERLRGGRSAPAETWHDRLLRQIRPDLERAFDPDLEDAVALVLGGGGAGHSEVRLRSRSAAVDELLELADRMQSAPGASAGEPASSPAALTDPQAPALKRIAAMLLVQPPPRAGALWCVVAGKGAAALRAIPRPLTRPEDIARARAEIAILCLDRRGLLAPAASSGPVDARGGPAAEPRSAPEPPFAIRAHACNVCSAWALALDELGVDLRPRTAPNVGRAPVRRLGGSALCSPCVEDHRAVLKLSREELGLDDAQAIAAAMPRPALSHLDAERARALRR
jgi:hypothetical protein